MSKFKLSEKIFDSVPYQGKIAKIYVSDVKEFIKRLLEGEAFCVMKDKVKKLAGDKLK